MAELISEATISSENEPIKASQCIVDLVVELFDPIMEQFHLEMLEDYADDAAAWAYFGVGGPA